MSDHEHDFWITLTGALECACGASRRPINDQPKEQK